jgi:hypothetical protein
MRAPLELAVMVAGLALQACGGRAESTVPNAGPSDGQTGSSGSNGSTGSGNGSSQDGGASSSATSDNDAGGVSATPDFPLGMYACTANATVSNGTGGGFPGTLTITQSGSVLTATYADTGSEFSGALEFTATTDSSANPAVPGQVFQALCVLGGGVDTVSVTSGSLTIDGNTLFLSLVGDYEGSDSCAGVQATISFVCSKG